MSTPNFRYPTLSKHYVYFATEDYEYEDKTYDIEYELKKIKGFEKGDYGYRGDDRRAIGSFDFYFYDRYSEQEERVSLYVTIEGGYYDGVMFDVDLSEIEELELSKTNQAKVDAKVRQIEKVLNENTSKLRRVAVFSNGEAIYEEAA